MKRSFVVIAFMLILALLLVGCASPSVNEETKPEGNVGDTNGETMPPIEEPTPPAENTPEQEIEKPSNPPIIERPLEPLVPIVRYDTILMATSSKVNIREGRGSHYRVIGSLRRGEALGMKSAEKNGWYEVYYKGKQGYISSSFVKMVHIKSSKNDAIERVVLEGKRMLGYPYVWGSQRYHWGNGILNNNFRMGEFDCSALMQYIYFKGARVSLDVTTRTQVMEGTVVIGEIRRGDLMFFTNSARRHKKGVDKVGHVGMYLGDNYMLHTASTYALIEEISASRWGDYLVAKRFL